MVDEVIDKAVVAELGTTDLHIKAEQLFARVGAAAEAIDALIAHNARVAQDQGEYQRSFDKLNTEYARLLADYDKLLTQINDLKNREAAYRYYKKELATLDPASIEASITERTAATPSSTTPESASTAPSHVRGRKIAGDIGQEVTVSSITATSCTGSWAPGYTVISW